MNLTRQELKSRARGELTGHYGVLILAQLLEIMCALVFGSFFVYRGGGIWNEYIALAGTLVVCLLLTVLRAGFSYLYLQLARGNQIQVGDLFYCFSHQPDRILVVCLLLFLLICLAAVPVTLIRSALTLLAGRLLFPAAGPIFIAFTYLLRILSFLSIYLLLMLHYGLTFFFCIDHPHWKSTALLRESRERMRGRRFFLFRLLLSFTGFLLLSVLTFGIGLFWVRPYLYMTLTEFYLENE